MSEKHVPKGSQPETGEMEFEQNYCNSIVIELYIAHS